MICPAWDLIGVIRRMVMKSKDSIHKTVSGYAVVISLFRVPLWPVGKDATVSQV